MPELKSTYIGELRIEVTGTHMVGDGPLGRRRIDLLNKGHFKGPKVQAKILQGMDALLGGGDGALRPDVRLVLELDDGHVLYIHYRGARHGSSRRFTSVHVDAGRSSSMRDPELHMFIDQLVQYSPYRAPAGSVA